MDVKTDDEDGATGLMNKGRKTPKLVQVPRLQPISHIHLTNNKLFRLSSRHSLSISRALRRISSVEWK